ncbi:hypothetical protein D3C80_1201140 [compost metagenome]
MHGFRAISYLCISLINVLVSIYLAKGYGAVGAAVGTTLSLILGNIIAMNIYYHYKVGLNIPRFFKELFKGLLISLIASTSLGITLLYISNNSWISLIIECVTYFIIYASISWIFGMNKYEKNLIAGGLFRTKRKLYA